MLSSHKLSIDISPNGITINNHTFTFPTIERRPFFEAIGEEPEFYFLDGGKYKFWKYTFEESGMLLFATGEADDSVIKEIHIYLDDTNEYVKPDTKNLYPGTLTIEGVDYKQALAVSEKTPLRNSRISVGLGAYGTTDVSVRHDGETICDITLRSTVDIEEKIEYPPVEPSKYVIKTVDDPAVFHDLNLKLLVLEHIEAPDMPWPAFNLEEFVRWTYEQGGRKIDLDKELFKPIPEVVSYYTDLQIPKAKLKKVKSLILDGGHTIYQDIIPQWDGEDEYFEVKDWSDIELLRNLRSITCHSPAPDNETIKWLQEKGIEVKT